MNLGIESFMSLYDLICFNTLAPYFSPLKKIEINIYVDIVAMCS